MALAVLWLIYQLHLRKELKEELSMLKGTRRHSVEYDMVLKVMKMAIWRIDLENKTITFESDFRNVVGSFHFSPNTPLNIFYDLMPPRDREFVRGLIEDLAEGRIEESHGQFQTRMPHSDQVHWEESYATVESRDQNGRPRVIVGTLTLIDDQKNLERELIEARNHAEESDRLKSAFLANMSHEIRTPLNAIVGFSDVLPMAQNEEEREELVRLIKKNNAHLLHLFDSMVNMSQLEAGGVAVKKEHFDVNLLLMDVADKFAEKSRQTGVKIEVNTRPAAMQLLSDRNRLREILNQYMDNAMKFTTHGTVTLGYQQENGKLRIWVRDTGKGIPSIHCNDHLFERFVKVDDFVPGTGLGLSICRSMALLIGGKVGVASKLNVGSTFWVDVPMEDNGTKM